MAARRRVCGAAMRWQHHAGCAPTTCTATSPPPVQLEKASAKRRRSGGSSDFTKSAKVFTRIQHQRDSKGQPKEEGPRHIASHLKL